MFSSVFSKTLYEKRWSLLGWSAGLLAMTILTMVFYPNFKQTGFEDVFKSLPESLRPLVGSVESYKTVQGYIGQQIYGLKIPIFLVVMGMVLFVGIGVDDEDKGTLQTLLAQPISRTSTYLQKALAGLCLLLAATLVIALSILLSLLLIHESYSFTRLAAATLDCFLMITAFGSLTFGVGLGFGKKSLAIGAASAYAFFCFITTSLAPAVEKLRPIEKLSVFYYYNNPNPAVVALNWAHLLFLIIFSSVFFAGGLFLFRRRDLS